MHLALKRARTLFEPFEKTNIWSGGFGDAGLGHLELEPIKLRLSASLFSYDCNSLTFWRWLQLSHILD